MDSTYGPRPYNKSNKVLPLSQSQQDQHKEITPDDASQNSVCSKHKSTFKTHRELQQHQRPLTGQYYLRNLFLSPQIHVIMHGTRIKYSSKVKWTLLTMKLHIGKKCFFYYQLEQQGRGSL